jgi:DNA-binding transcriptional regulator PaaX
MTRFEQAVQLAEDWGLVVQIADGVRFGYFPMCRMIQIPKGAAHHDGTVAVVLHEIGHHIADKMGFSLPSFYSVCRMATHQTRKQKRAIYNEEKRAWDRAQILAQDTGIYDATFKSVRRWSLKSYRKIVTKPVNWAEPLKLVDVSFTLKLKENSEL